MGFFGNKNARFSVPPGGDTLVPDGNGVMYGPDGRTQVEAWESQLDASAHEINRLRDKVSHLEDVVDGLDRENQELNDAERGALDRVADLESRAERAEQLLDAKDAVIEVLQAELRQIVEGLAKTPCEARTVNDRREPPIAVKFWQGRP